MRKLATDSWESANEIKQTLDDISSHLCTIINSIKDADSVASSYIESIQSIKSILNTTVSLAEELEKDFKN